MADPIKLFIGVSSTNGGTSIFADSMARFYATHRGFFIYKRMPSLGVGLARDHLVHEFLKTDCTDLLFIDSDIGFSSEDVGRICSHDVDVVTGCYALKAETEKPTLVLSLVDGARANTNGLIECVSVGCGFLRIRRAVFDQLRVATPHKSFKNDRDEIEHDYFPEGVEDGRYYGEDIAFCRNWRKLGGRIFADFGIRLDHEGFKIYGCEAVKQTTSTNNQD
jgi:hypothetical protein